MIRSSENDLPRAKQKLEFVLVFDIGLDFDASYILVPLPSIMHPIFVFGDCSGSPSQFFCALPRRNWVDCFSEKIVVADQDGDGTASDFDDCVGEEEDLSSVRYSTDKDAEQL